MSMTTFLLDLFPKYAIACKKYMQVELSIVCLILGRLPTLVAYGKSTFFVQSFVSLVAVADV